MATRRVCIARATPNPTLEWVAQAARNLTDCEGGGLLRKHLLISDRDALYSHCFKSIIASSGIEILPTAYQAPKMNAYAERFVIVEGLTRSSWNGR